MAESAHRKGRLLEGLTPGRTSSGSATGSFANFDGDPRIGDDPPDVWYVWWFRVELPPVEEQRAIAAFLDRETARIDALVAKKERLIELLQEKRTALITRAVTKGLDPTVPMKDSGVEWLGEIPAHWEVKRLGKPVYASRMARTSRPHYEAWRTAP